MAEGRWFTVVEDTGTPANFPGILQGVVNVIFRGHACVSGCHHWLIADGMVTVPASIVRKYKIKVTQHHERSESALLRELVSVAHPKKPKKNLKLA